jgi:hypothetical protein
MATTEPSLARFVNPSNSSSTVGIYMLYLQAVGKPGLTNNMSYNGVPYGVQ